MITKGKVVKLRTTPEAHGNICGFETSNGMPGCNQADTALHVMNYLDGLLVSRTPLPMGLHCQAPLRYGAEVLKELLAAATKCHPLHAAWWHSWLWGNHQLNHFTDVKKLNLSVVALSSKPVTLNPLLCNPWPNVLNPLVPTMLLSICCLVPLQLPLHREVQVWWLHHPWCIGWAAKGARRHLWSKSLDGWKSIQG